MTTVKRNGKQTAALKRKLQLEDRGCSQLRNQLLSNKAHLGKDNLIRVSR